MSEGKRSRHHGVSEGSGAYGEGAETRGPSFAGAPVLLGLRCQ